MRTTTLQNASKLTQTVFQTNVLAQANFIYTFDKSVFPYRESSDAVYLHCSGTSKIGAYERQRRSPPSLLTLACA